MTPRHHALRELKVISRFLLKVFLLAVLLLLFPGLSHTSEEACATTELHLWHQWREEKQETLGSIIKDFNCRTEDASIIAEPLGPIAGSVAERMQISTSTEQPELALVEREAIPILVDAGLLRPWDDLLTPSGILQKSNLQASAQLYGTFNGKLYGLPATLNPYVLIYDETLLTQFGISSLPSSWEDFVTFTLKMGKEGQQGGVRPWVLNARSMAPILNIICAQKAISPLEANENPQRTQQIREALEFLAQLRHSHSLMPPQFKFWDPNFVDITSRKLLFQIDDAEMLAHLLEKTSVPLSAATVPCDSSPARTLLSGSPVFVLPRGSRDDGGLLKFLEFFYSAEQYSRFIEKLLFVSPLRSVQSVLTQAPAHSLYSELSLAAESAEVFPLRPNSGKAFSQVGRSVEQMDSGLLTPGQALANILEAGKQGAAQGMLANRGVQVAWAESTRRVFTDDVSAFYDVPVELMSAGNEHEAFQLMLSAESQMGGLEVEAMPFVSEEGATYHLETVTYLERDTLISKPLVSQRPGLYPNTLRAARKFDITPGNLTRLWVDIFVPEGVPAGVLSSQTIIRHGGSTIARIPIRLRVLPLSLPASPSQPAAVGLNYELIAKHYGLKNGTKAYRKLMDSFYWFMVGHRLSPYQPPVPIESAAVKTYLTDKRVSCCRIPFAPEDPRYAKAVRRAEEGGWLEKLFVYFIDEPTYHQYEAVTGIGKAIHSAKVHPKFLVSCFPDKMLIGAVDIWCIHMPFLPVGVPHSFVDRTEYVEAVDKRLEAGDKVWWYTAGAIKPFPTLQIEDDPAAFRIIPWLQQMYRIDGFLHWEAANWSQPFDEPLVPYFGNGEGVLVYPGEGQPSPSVRLELLREGMEDMECLMLLRRTLEKTQGLLGAEKLGDIASIRVAEICRRLITDGALREQAENGLFLLPHFRREPGEVERVRGEVLGEIIGAQNSPLALVLTEPQEKMYTNLCSVRIYGVAERGSKVEVNGQKQAVDEGGSFSSHFPLTQGTNAFCIRIENGQKSKILTRKIEKF